MADATAPPQRLRYSLGSRRRAVTTMLGRPASTVWKVLRRWGHSRRPRIPRPPVVRYERAQPGVLLHLDTKKLGRFWQVGQRITGDGIHGTPARAGSMCLSPSTTTPG